MITCIKSKTFIDQYGGLYFDVSCEKDTGEVIEKRLAAEDYLDLFRNSVEQEEYREIVKLPPEVVWASQTVKQDTFKAVIIYPAKKRPMFFMGQIFPEVPFPALCAFVTVENGVRTGTMLFALKKPDLDAKLCVYPFGNVSSSNGSCCFGNISCEHMKNASEASKILDRFLEGETNSDYYSAISTNGGYDSQGELLEYLKDKNVFPKKLLKERNETVKSLFE